MLIKMTSQLSGKSHTRDINLTPQQLTEVLNRKQPIQKIVPHLSSNDREFLMTGITPEEWDETFKDD